VGQTDAIAGCREDRIHVGTGPFCRLHDLVPTFYMTYTSTDVTGRPKRFYGHPEAFEGRKADGRYLSSATVKGRT